MCQVDDLRRLGVHSDGCLGGLYGLGGLAVVGNADEVLVGRRGLEIVAGARVRQGDRRGGDVARGLGQDVGPLLDGDGGGGDVGFDGIGGSMTVVTGVASS